MVAVATVNGGYLRLIFEETRLGLGVGSDQVLGVGSSKEIFL